MVENKAEFRIKQPRIYCKETLITTLMEKSVKIKAKPFLKWAGGKTQLIKDIDAHLPEEIHTGRITTYIEPFIGGGAVFFHIAQKYETVKKFILLDINKDLIGCYNKIKSDVENLIHELLNLQEHFLSLTQSKRKNYYLNIRIRFNKEKKSEFSTKTAAKLIFLNRTCFNGLYRVNRSGEFNVPIGSYKKPRICDGDNLRAVSTLLQKATIICADYKDCFKYIDDKTFLYFDPPYRPLSSTASFTAYSKEDFNEEDQKQLADFCKLINGQGAKLLLSNSDPKNEDPKDHFFKDHYPEKWGFTIDTVKASRIINCKPSGRGQINELLITNY